MAYADEQEVVSTAVISVLHSLMAIANNAELDATVRIDAAAQVLAYAFEVAPLDDDRDDEADEAEESESDGKGAEG